MVSAAKRLANRLNAQKSTGPRTEEGKAVAAANALRHGAFAQYLLLPGEDAAELRELKCSTVRRLDPRDGLELRLVERIVVAIWKLQRIQRFERARHVRETSDFGWHSNPSRESCGLGAEEAVPPEIAQFGPYHFHETHDRLADLEYRLENTLNRALRQLTALRKQEPADVPGEFAAQVIAAERSSTPQTQKLQNEATASDTPQAETALTDGPAEGCDQSPAANPFPARETIKLSTGMPSEVESEAKTKEGVREVSAVNFDQAKARRDAA